MTIHAPIVADDFDEEIAWVINLATEIDHLNGPARDQALIDFARSDVFTAAGLIDDGILGQFHRQAYLALKRARDKETPGRAWAQAYSTADRPAICRALKIDHADPLAFFATFPFRILRSEGERPWIAAAIGCQRILDPQSLARWEHFDIVDVILWNPRSGAIKVAGDAGANLIECPDYDDGRHTIYGEPFAFFRAWAEKRAVFAATFQAARASRGAIIPSEPVGNCLPGTLVIGDLDKVHWRDLSATVLVAGPGIDPAALKRAVFRSARLPSVEAA